MRPSQLMSRSPRGPALFSMPLAYPSTLDRRVTGCACAGDRRPTWRGFGARAAVGRAKIAAQSTGECRCAISARAPRVFLSQAGPRFVICASSS
jgi:hypothetical protein